VTDFAELIREQADRFYRATLERQEILTICAMVDAIPALHWVTHLFWARGTMHQLMSGKHIVPIGCVWHGPSSDGEPRMEIRSEYAGRRALVVGSALRGGE
jgi:hypothetical protein